MLYKPYKNIVEKFYKLATERDFIHFDVITKEFNGINSAPDYIKHYYESMLGVTSYFQASKGGRGKYIEKKLASVSENCFLDFRMSDLPLLFYFPSVLKKKKLYGN